MKFTCNKAYFQFLILLGCIVLFPLVSGSDNLQVEVERVKPTDTKPPRINLRSTYRELSIRNVRFMIKEKKLFDSNWNIKGDFDNDYELYVVGKDKAVLDHATGLMWHQSGSAYYMELSSAKKWLDRLNGRGYAGYSDWRLPTVEEAATLLEAGRQKNNLFVDPIFNKKQKWIWTGDKKNKLETWCVYFNLGYIRWSYTNLYVRPVRIHK